MSEHGQTIPTGGAFLAWLCAALCLCLVGCNERRATTVPGGASVLASRTNTTARLVSSLAPPLPGNSSASAAAAPPGGTVTATLNILPSTNATGYKLWWGAASHNYTNAINAGTNLVVSFTNLVRGVRYYFAATAYDASGLDSPFSNEAIFPAPVTNYLTVFVESSGAVNGLWTNYWSTTLTNPPAASQFFRFGIRSTNSGNIVRLNASTLQVSNTNQP